MNIEKATKEELLDSLARYEEELEYQVNHKRIAFLQEQIIEIEVELKKRNEKGLL